MYGNNNRGRKGGPMDDVAQNIRAEQNADAMPSPEEAKRQHRQWMADEGCQVCGEDDPDALTTVAVTMHKCSRHQHPPGPPELLVFCEEHARPSQTLWRARIIQKARKRDDTVAVAIYECRIIEYVEEPEPKTVEVEEVVDWDDDGDPIYEMVEKAQPYSAPRPSAHIVCGCGADLEEIVRLDNDEEETNGAPHLLDFDAEEASR